MAPILALGRAAGASAKDVLQVRAEKMLGSALGRGRQGMDSESAGLAGVPGSRKETRGAVLRECRCRSGE